MKKRFKRKERKKLRLKRCKSTFKIKKTILLTDWKEKEKQVRNRKNVWEEPNEED